MATFFRILRQRDARRSDFISDLANGLPQRPPQRKDVLCWCGVSVFPTLDEAAVRARRYRLGEWIAQLEIPDGDAGRYALAQTTKRQEHFSIAADPALLVSYVAHVLPLPLPALTETDLVR